MDADIHSDPLPPGAIARLGTRGRQDGGYLFTGRALAFYSVAFSPDGKTAATAEESGLRLWDTRSGREKRRLLWNQDDGVADVAFSPDGRLLACGDHEGLVRVWEMPSGRQKQQFERLEKRDMNQRLKTVAFIDNRILVAGTNNGIKRLWDVAQGRVLHTFDRSDGWTLDGIVVSSGKKMLATADANGRVIRLLDADGSRAAARLGPRGCD